MNTERYHHRVSDRWADYAVWGRWIDIEWAVLQEIARLDHLDTARLRGEVEQVQFPAVAGLVDPGAIRARERDTGHDVGAFLEVVEEGMLRLGLTQCARWLHWGLTSSDLVDTGVAWATRLSISDLAYEVVKLRQVITGLPFDPICGRTHGQPASPTTVYGRFAHTLPLLSYEPDRVWAQFPVMLSGAVGRYRVFPPQSAQRAADSLGGVVANSTSQVMSPAWMADQLHLVSKWVLGAEKIALDLRLMATLGEYRPRPVKVGSSTMPGKVNPYLAERVCGLAKLWRGMHSAWVESRALWLERDLHHSSVDRQLGELFELAGYMLVTVRGLLKDAQWVLQDLSGFEPSIDADRILAESVERVDKPRSWLYGRVRDAISEELLGPDPSTAGVCDRLGWF